MGNITVIPLGDNFVVEKELESKIKSSILVIPDQLKTNSLFAKVKYSPKESLGIPVNSRVLLKPDSGESIGDNDYIVHHNEIVGIDDGEFPLKMIRDHILVSAISTTNASEHIYLPERGSGQTEMTGIDDTQVAVVVSVGRGYSSENGVIPLDVRAGEYVVFHGDITAGISVIIEGEEYRILRERDIMFTFTEDER